jgi:hypothetical protein
MCVMIGPHAVEKKETAMPRLQDRTDVAKLGAPGSVPAAAATNEGKPRALTRPEANPVWQPDRMLVGKEQAHQWLLPWVFGALFLIGVLTAARGWQQVEYAAASGSWPYTRGVIVSSEVESFSSSQGVRWRPVVTYLYRVGKHERLGTRVSLVDPVSGFDEDDARAFAERYRLHGDVLVYYNPDHLTESVLDQSAPRSAYLAINLGLALATAAGTCLLLSLRSGKRKPRHRAAIAQ